VSLLLMIIVFCFLALVFIQFGGRLSARYALTWWVGGLFLLVCSVVPDVLRPLADLLGIALISNLVLSALILFLFFQLIDLTSDLSRLDRRLRCFVASDGASGRNFTADKANKKYLVVVPCFNEELNIPSVVQDLFTQSQDGAVFDFVVIDDGSSDSSSKILASIAPDHHMKHKVNIGVSGVLMTGFMYALQHGYKYVVQCDCDGQHPIDRIQDLFQTAEKEGFDLLVGSRFLGSDLTDVQTTTSIRMVGIFLLRVVLSLFGNRSEITDPTSGFRVYSSRAMKYLLDCMPDEYPEPETVALIRQVGMKSGEIAVKMSPRSAGVSSLSGLKQIRYFMKVSTALLGLRIRNIGRHHYDR
jgi:hypothetical protein